MNSLFQKIPSSLSRSELIIVTSAWWVTYDQILKREGTHEVRGKKNFLPPAMLVLGYGMLWSTEDEETQERHARKLGDGIEGSGLVGGGIVEEEEIEQEEQEKANDGEDGTGQEEDDSGAEDDGEEDTHIDDMIITDGDGAQKQENPNDENVQDENTQYNNVIEDKY